MPKANFTAFLIAASLGTAAADDVDREAIRERLMAEYVTQAIECIWTAFSFAEKAEDNDSAKAYRGKLNAAWFNYFVLTQGDDPVVRESEKFVQNLLPDMLPIIQEAESFNDPWVMGELWKLAPETKFDGTWGGAAKRSVRYRSEAEYFAAVAQFHRWLTKNAKREQLQDGAHQSATAADAKSEGNEKPKPESEGRSQ